MIAAAAAAGDTIVALSSGRPPAAVAVVRTSGPQAIAMLEAVAGRPAPVARAVTLRKLRDPDNGELIDEALILLFPAPASATGEDVVEYQCHGGRAVVERLLAVLTSLDGARLAEPGEFTRRALINGRIDLTEAEGLADLLEAETEAQRRSALALAEGGLRRQAEAWRAQILALSARAEAAIDYVGDEDETALDVAALVTQARAMAADIRGWLARPRAERLREGARVVAAGPPNAGKSSLINALAESERAIVTPIPGTTRDVIEIPIQMDGLPLVLVDTAGVRASDDPVERIGVARAEQEARCADILVWLGDGTPPSHSNVIALHPRTDLPGREVPPAGRIAVSVSTGLGLDTVRAEILARVRDVLPDPGTVALNVRQAACLTTAADALDLAHGQADIAVVANSLTIARAAFDRLTGHAGVDDLLDALFSRFCLGK